VVWGYRILKKFEYIYEVDEKPQPYPQYFQGVFDVTPDGLLTDVQLLRDLLVG